MAICEFCGAIFDPEDAEEEFDMWADDHDCDVEIDDVFDGDICADCAISMAEEGLAAGARDMSYFTD